MHPAYSVIFFTTASGAGYGLLTLLALGAGLGWLPPDRTLGFAGLSLALGLITAGLLSSTAHLGRPARAWRAFSQWRSSWLSREGVLAVATYVPAGGLGLGWAILGRTGGVFAVCAWLAVGLALATVFATGMIYQSLPSIRHWHQPLTTPVYVVLALATGGLLLVIILRLTTGQTGVIPLIVQALLLVAVGLKFLYWRAVDRTPPLASPESATGLGRFGAVRQLEAPHSQANYVMREMGYAVGRKHARRLRFLVLWLLFALPCVLISQAMFEGAFATACVLLATVSAAIGVVTERWLFFAEAEHVVMTYYGGGRRHGITSSPPPS